MHIKPVINLRGMRIGSRERNDYDTMTDLPHPVLTIKLL